MAIQNRGQKPKMEYYKHIQKIEHDILNRKINRKETNIYEDYETHVFLYNHIFIKTKETIKKFTFLRFSVMKISCKIGVFISSMS